jgi:glycosyltransferase involved in cell wall biosynthesis
VEGRLVDVLIAGVGAWDGWEVCLRSLAQSGHDLRFSALVEHPGQTGELRSYVPELREVVALTPSEGLEELRDKTRPGAAADLLVLSRPVVVPPGVLDEALVLISQDMRVATVSFLTNDADYLSFPHRNTPITHQVENLDEVAITRRLRQRTPQLRPAPIPVPVGPMTLLADAALDALGGDIPRRRQIGDLVAALSLALQIKGFISVVDPATFYATPHDLGWRSHTRTGGPLASTSWRAPDESPGAEPPLQLGNVEALLAEEEVAATSPFAVAHQVARAKVLGLRVGLDGTCLGPRMMGTQVQTLAIVGALSRHDEVAEVTVALAGPVPSYARTVFNHHKIRVVAATDDDMSNVGSVDVLHRPFQPVRPIDVESWRKVASRVAVSILDVIAYRNGAYHFSGESWLGYRRAIQSTVEAMDGATVISADVKEQMLIDRLPIDAGRIHVVELGTDHLAEGEPERPPDELFARGFLAEEFLVVLGASYAHKNRDQAIRALQELRRRGRRLGLVLVGAAVPHGSSRPMEARALVEEPTNWLWNIPDVAVEERNWLMAHAAAVLYPTSAEGFGFIPFEAARFGTPTVCVPFGPLAELAPDLPVVAASWDPVDLADAVEQLLSDPGAARSQVEKLKAAGSQYTWHRTASKLANFYRELLASPAR